MVGKKSWLRALWLRRWIFLLALSIGVVAVYGGIRLFPSEEKKVRKRFELLEKWVSKEGEEGVLVAARRSQNVGSLFSDASVFHSIYPTLSGVLGSRSIAQLTAQFRAEVSKVSLEFDISKVEFPEASGTAKVLAVGKMRGKLTGGEDFGESHGVTFKLEKIEGKWLFTEVRIFDGLGGARKGFY